MEVDSHRVLLHKGDKSGCNVACTTWRGVERDRLVCEGGDGEKTPRTGVFEDRDGADIVPCAHHLSPIQKTHPLVVDGCSCHTSCHSPYSPRKT